MSGARRNGMVGLMVAAVLFSSACQYLPPVPAIPFLRSEPTPTPEPAPKPSPSPPPKPAAPAFSPFWVKNHRLTEMWSGPAGQADAISFGTTTAQFCSFQVVRPPDNARLYVFNPYSNNYLWIDQDAVGPVSDPPERRSGPKPANQNCAEAIYEG